MKMRRNGFFILKQQRLNSPQLSQLFDQISQPDTDQNQAASKTQRGWLKLDCPTGTTPRSLCVNFFTILDDLLGNTESQ